jgi:nucleoside phosphorylase/DNA-binding transcriptional MerR regulator
MDIHYVYNEAKMKRQRTAPQTAEDFNISLGTLRDWTKLYAKHFSQSAQIKHGRGRTYTPGDLMVIKRIQDLTNVGKSPDEIDALLRLNESRYAEEIYQTEKDRPGYSKVAEAACEMLPIEDEVLRTSIVNTEFYEAFKAAGQRGELYNSSGSMYAIQQDVMNRVTRRAQQPIDVAIITVLPEEYEAVKRLIPDCKSVGPNDVYRSQTGTIPTESLAKTNNIVLSMIGESGLSPAASAATTIIERWRPRYVILCGIAAANPRENISKGNVVISVAVWEDDYGKVAEDYQPRPRINEPDLGLVNLAREMNLESRWTELIEADPPDPSTPLPEVKFGLIGSGNQVIDNPDHPFVEQILNQWPPKQLLALEMEASAIGSSIKAAKSMGRNTDFIVIRCISDVPPEGTGPRDQWKPYAANVAAAFAISLVSKIGC